MKRLTLPVLLIASAEVFSDFYDPGLRSMAKALDGFSSSGLSTIESHLRSQRGHPLVDSIRQSQESDYVGYDPLY